MELGGGAAVSYLVGAALEEVGDGLPCGFGDGEAHPLDEGFFSSPRIETYVYQTFNQPLIISERLALDDGVWF